MVGSKRGVATVAAFAMTIGLSAHSASAYDASLVWLPVAGAHGYKVYVSQTAEPNSPGTDMGVQAPGSDGLIRHSVHGLPLNTTSYFWITSYNANKVESAFSNDLSLTASAIPPGTGGTPTPMPNSQPSTPTPTATWTPNPRRAVKLVLSGTFYTRPTRRITYVARYQNAKQPIVIALTPPSNLSPSKVYPAATSAGSNMILWQNIQRSYGKVRVTFPLGDQVPAGSVFSASASLVDSHGFIANSSATVTVTHAARAADP
jgi:hypothetical protein